MCLLAVEEESSWGSRMRRPLSPGSLRLTYTAEPERSLLGEQEGRHRLRPRSTDRHSAASIRRQRASSWCVAPAWTLLIRGDGLGCGAVDRPKQERGPDEDCRDQYWRDCFAHFLAPLGCSVLPAISRCGPLSIESRLDSKQRLLRVGPSLAIRLRKVASEIHEENSPCSRVIPVLGARREALPGVVEPDSQELFRARVGGRFGWQRQLTHAGAHFRDSKVLVSQFANGVHVPGAISQSWCEARVTATCRRRRPSSVAGQCNALASGTTT